MNGTADINTRLEKAIAQRHRAPEWSLIFELRAGTGYGATGYGGSREQRIDAFAINNYPSKGQHRHAYEIKASRADFLRELRDPAKREIAMGVSNYFWFIIPAGIVRRTEVPPSCGLIEVDEDGDSKKVLQAPYRRSQPPTWNFIAALLRRKDG